MDIDLTEAEIQRYARHILLPEVGGTGQMRLKSGRVLIAGLGGLGCPLLLYLAAAGVGTIGLADHDKVEISNLQRQVAYQTASLGRIKIEAAAAVARALNPHIGIHAHQTELDASNVDALIANYDLICDALDNSQSRTVLADACAAQSKVLVTAAVSRFEGHVSVFKPYADPLLPCYHCLYPVPSLDGSPSCAEAGILGSIVGVVGTLQATEVLKELLGIGESLAGRLLIWDALAVRFRVIRVPRDPACRFCNGS